jgi:hypothetical protein
MPALADVVWIGGSACSGKSTVADGLACELGLGVYHCDDHWYGPSDHLARATPAREPFLCLWRDRTRAREWFLTPPQEHAAIMNAAFREELPMIAADLLRGGAGIVEGVSVTPRVLREAVPRARAVFLISTPSFRRARYLDRGFAREWVEAYDDPAVAFETLMAANDLMAKDWRAEAEAAGYPVVLVDGSQGPADAYAAVVAALGLG